MDAASELNKVAADTAKNNLMDQTGGIEEVKMRGADLHAAFS